MSESVPKVFDKTLVNKLTGDGEARSMLMNFVGYPPQRFDQSTEEFENPFDSWGEEELGETTPEDSPELVPVDEDLEKQKALRSFLSEVGVDQEIMADIESVLLRIRALIENASINLQLQAAESLFKDCDQIKAFSHLDPKDRIPKLIEKAPCTPVSRGERKEDRFERDIGPFVTGAIAEEVFQMVKDLLEDGKVEVLTRGEYRGDTATLEDFESRPGYMVDFLMSEAEINEEYLSSQGNW